MASAAAKKMILPCLYTKHKIKKRKAWNDGKLVVSDSGQCVLYDANSATKITAGTSMDAVLLRGEELLQVLSGGEIEIEMEHHLVTIEELPVEPSIAPSSRPPPAAAAVPVRRAQNQNVDNSSSALAHCQADLAKQQKRTRPSAPWPPSTAPVSVAASAVRPELAKPFKPPAFRPPAAPAPAAAAAAPSSSAAAISERYKGQYGGTGTDAGAGAGAGAEGGGGANAYNARYEGVAGSAGNGRYVVSSDEIDDMWAEEEALEQQQERQEQQQPRAVEVGARTAPPVPVPAPVPAAAAQLQLASPKAASPKAASDRTGEEADVWGCLEGDAWGGGGAAQAGQACLQDTEDIWDI